MDLHFVAPSLKRIDDAEPGLIYSLSTTLADARRFVISGPPGAGKTTILRYLGSEAFRHASSLSFFLTLSGISSPSSLSGILLTAIADGIDTLLLDDLDTVPSELEVSVCRHLQEAISPHPHLRVVIATRRIAPGALQALVGFAHFEVLPFDQYQVIEFLSKYSRCPHELESAIRKSQQLSSVSSNPLLLKIMTEYEDALLSGNLVLDPRAILRESIRLSFSHAVTRVRLPEDMLNRILRIVAVELTLSGRVLINQTEVEHLTRDALSATQWTPPTMEVLMEALTTTGLMVRRDASLSFMHRTIQEFFLTDYLRAEGHAPETDIVLNRSKDVVASLRLVDHPDRSLLHAFSQTQVSTPPIPCDTVFPLYARRGSIELFLAFVGVSAAGFALSKFAEGFFRSWGESAAGQLRRRKTLSETAPPSVVALAPDWVQNNPQALDRFLQSLTEEYGRTAGRALAEVDLTARYLEAVYETSDRGSIIVVAGEAALRRLNKGLS